MVHCQICNSDKEITTPGQYANVLSCGHVVTGMTPTQVINSNIKNDNGNTPTLVEAAQISEKIQKTEELPEIDKDDLVKRALATMTQHYEDFFIAESTIIEDLISQYGNDKTVLILTAYHEHLSRVLFAVGRFRNMHFNRIESMRKEIESQAVKELIANHDFYHNPNTAAKKPLKPRSPKINTEMGKAKEALSGLTDKDGKPIDVTSLVGKLMWGQSKKELEEADKKEDYKAGLDKIADSISKRKKEDDDDAAPMIKD